MDKRVMKDIEASGLYSLTYDFPYFSWHGCDHPECEEKGKGATVYDMKGYRCLDDAQNNNDNYYEFRLCEYCLNLMCNGE